MDTDGVNCVLRALEVVHEPRSSSEVRREAQAFLEDVKHSENAPYWGYQLALPNTNSPANNNEVVRHYGLSLLQHAVIKNFDTLDGPKIAALREWIVALAGKAHNSDLHFLREKVAFVWVALAKRIWGAFSLRDDVPDAPLLAADLAGGWASMDADLWALWNAARACRELSLVVLSTLFEDIYLLDDPHAAKRSAVLNQLSVAIVTPADVLEQLYEATPALDTCKSSREGWFVAWTTFLTHLLSENDASSPAVQTFVPKLLGALKTCLNWVQPVVMRLQNVMTTLVGILAVPNTRFKTLAVDCLQILFTRSYASADDFDYFVGRIFSSEGVAKLADFHRSLVVDPDNLCEQTYTLLKKTVEMIVSLSEYLKALLPAKARVDWDKADVHGYLQLVLATTAHPSPIVLGLLLQMWATMLRYDELSARAPVCDLLMDLLQVAADRTLDYAQLPAQHVSRRFFDIDFDSLLEAASFLANYRKYNEDIVRITVCKKPEEGMQWLDKRLQAFFGSAVGAQCITDAYLDEKSEVHIYGTAQFTAIENSIRGVSRWRIWYSGSDLDARNVRLNTLVEDLGERLLDMQLASPLLIRKQVQTMVQFAPLLKDVSPLMFKVLEKILTTAIFEYPENISDERREVIRDLRTSCGTELNRLAYIMPELLKNIFGDLEKVVANILEFKKVSSHEIVAFKSFLLVILSRSSISDKDTLFAKIVDPELAAWALPDTEKGLADLHWFMERIGIVEIAQYFQKRNVTADTNLLDTKIDDEGRQLKSQLTDRWVLVFPIRATRIFIQYSIEKLDHASAEYRNLLRMWRPRVRPIVPHILQLLKQIQAYHNSDNWADLPAAVVAFLRYSRMERFWQQGVSIQSKETFIEESVRATLTLREFADSVGHLIRYTREYAYLTIGSLLQLEDTLYDMPGIASQLWAALAGDARGVTLHSWKHMINSCLRSVVKNCPVKYVDSFLGELLPKALMGFDQLLDERWDKMYVTGLQLVGNEDDSTLSEEMMEEHMLRQLTATAVRFLMDVVPQVNAKAVSDTQLACKRLVCTNKDVMAPFLQICCRIIALKDSKCSFNTLLVVRSILPAIVSKDDEVDKYLCCTFMNTLVGVLTDDYFAETHLETATVLTTLYCSLRAKNDLPAQFLLGRLPNVTPQQMANFETLLARLRSLKHQRAALMELVRLSKTGEDFGGDDELKMRKKRLEEVAVLKKKLLAADILNDPFTENGALETIFGPE